MKITELNGQLAKISKNSITVKDDNCKTIGVITNCRELSVRESSEVWGKTRKAVGLDAAKCINQMRSILGKIVYLENINNPDQNAEKLRNAGFEVARYRLLA